MSFFNYNASVEDEITGLREVVASKREIAEAVAELMRSLAPVDSGEYRDSIQVFEDGDDISVGSTDDKAHIIEFGSLDTPTFAVLRRAAEQIVGTRNVR